MNKITHITPLFAVTGALQPADFAEAARLGFKSILSNLPDGESPNYPSSAHEAVLAREVGLAFRHIPATKFEVFGDRVVEGTHVALRELEGPVLAHCASGLRSALAWAAAAARYQSVDCVLATLGAAGFKLDAVREELAELHDPDTKGPILPALDANCAGR